MKGVYKARVSKLTILGRMNDINVQVEMELEYEYGVSSIDIVKEITAFWHAAGMQPPVPGKPTQRFHSEQVSGANGTHPDDLIPFVRSDGLPYQCPVCQKKLYTKSWTSKAGNDVTKWYCPKPVGGCGAWNFGTNMEPRKEEPYKNGTKLLS